jgi:hypothetical protein
LPRPGGLRRNRDASHLHPAEPTIPAQSLHRRHHDPVTRSASDQRSLPEPTAAARSSTSLRRTIPRRVPAAHAQETMNGACGLSATRPPACGERADTHSATVWVNAHDVAERHIDRCHEKEPGSDLDAVGEALTKVGYHRSQHTDPSLRSVDAEPDRRTQHRRHASPLVTERDHIRPDSGHRRLMGASDADSRSPWPCGHRSPRFSSTIRIATLPRPGS